MDLKFEVLMYRGEQRIEKENSLATVAQAKAHPDRVREACSKYTHIEVEGEAVRLKNGVLRLLPGDVEVNKRYEENLKYRLLSTTKSEEELTKEECLIALAYAAQKNDVDEEVEELVKYIGEDILATRMPFDYLGTVLHVCANWGSIDTLEKVLKTFPEGVDVYLLDTDGDTALHNLPNCTSISYDDCKRAARLLLGHQGVNANDLLSKQNYYGNMTALCKALVCEQRDVCRALLDAGKEIMEASGSSKTDSMEASESSKKEASESSKTDPNWLTFQASDILLDNRDTSMTALHLATWLGYDDIVTKILAYPGARKLSLTSLQDDINNTPLHFAAFGGNTEICSTLLKYSMEINKVGENVRSKNANEETPLHLSSACGHIGVCEKLLEYGAPLEMRDKHGKYALTNALFNGHKQVVEKLLDACLRRCKGRKGEENQESSKQDGNKKPKYSINEKFERGFTPLHVAAAISSAHHVSSLLNARTSVDSRNNDGSTPLHIATEPEAFFRPANESKESTVDVDIPEQTALHINVDVKDQSGISTEDEGDAANSTEIQKDESEKRCEDERTADEEDVDEKSLCEVVKKLLHGGAQVEVQDCDGETALHKAARRHGRAVLRTLLCETKSDKKSYSKSWIAMSNFSGETALHNAAKAGRPEIVKELLDAPSPCGKLLRARDMESKTALDWAAIHLLDAHSCCNEFLIRVRNLGNLTASEWAERYIGKIQELEQMEMTMHLDQDVHSRCYKLLWETDMLPKTAFAWAKNFQQLRKLRSKETALHKAAHRLLHARSDMNKLLDEQDTEPDGKALDGAAEQFLNACRECAKLLRMTTALDCTAKHPQVSMIHEMMKKTTDESITKGFLMWNLRLHTSQDFCNHVKEIYGVKVDEFSLLEDAVRNEEVEVARELINRGAHVPSLGYKERRWLAENLGKRASDQPTGEDTLGRKALVQGVATLLLNPYTETPLTIGIFGTWGSGKSSFMLQVEKAMLHMAVKETFRNIDPHTSSHDKEAPTLNFTRKGTILRYMVVKALKQRMIQDGKGKDEHDNQGTRVKALDQSRNKEDKDNQYNQSQKEKEEHYSDIENQNGSNKDSERRKEKDKDHIDMENHKSSNKDYESQKEEDDAIENFPIQLQSEYNQLFKDLALIDRSKLVRPHMGAWKKRNAGMNVQTLQDIYVTGYTPAVLILHYNAWHYDNRTEASAGLAVEINRQLESFMTPHQWIRMCWRYSWHTRPKDMLVHLLLPILLALVAVCVVLMIWKLVPIATKFKALSLPMGIVGVMVAFFKTSLSVIKPVSETLLNNPKSIDHQSLMGYQHHVIHDINFLKEQLCEDAHFGWKIISLLCWFFISNRYFMEGTWIWKQHPRLDNFRIVVIIDDLDRCDEKTILQILRATHLILGSCGISALIGVDKGMVQRAISKEILNDADYDKVGDKSNKVVPEERGPPVKVENVDKKAVQEEDSEKVEAKQKRGSDEKNCDSRQFAEKYLQKIIQLPVELPDPSKEYIKHFLEGQLGKAQEDSADTASRDGRKNGAVVFRLLLANYSPMENDLLTRLSRFTTKEREVPREWKRFLNYHRLAWTILSQDPEIRNENLRGWERRLILWIFICWNWRDQMDAIFENWNDIISKVEESKGQKYPKLCQIIDTYMKNKGWIIKENVGSKGGDTAPQAWIDLYEKLRDEYDISLCFIEKFQQFRFYCKLNHLEIDKKYKA